MEAAYTKLLCAKHLELWGPPLENAAAGGRRPWPYICSTGNKTGKTGRVSQINLWVGEIHDGSSKYLVNKRHRSLPISSTAPGRTGHGRRRPCTRNCVTSPVRNSWMRCSRCRRRPAQYSIF